MFQGMVREPNRSLAPTSLELHVGLAGIDFSYPRRHDMISALIVVLGSVPIVLLSRRCLFSPGTHGFYRFFAFELILVLVVVNAPSWFLEPFVPRQLVSWVLLVLSIPLALQPVHLLRSAGRPALRPGTETDLAFERTTRLVTTGVYRYVRHPMYASLLCLTWGAALKSPTGVSLALAAAATGFLVATAKIEERENVVHFGDEYRAYMRHTRLFIPWLF